MTTVTGTDMRPFEQGLAERWCHIIPRYDDGTEDTVYVCGLPVDEPSHADCEDVDGRCVVCGLLTCPDCERLWWERHA